MANEITKVTDQNGVDHPFKDVAAFPRSEQAVLGAKNLLPNNAVSKTDNNVTWTVDQNGVITANGTPEGGNSTNVLVTQYLLKAGSYILSGAKSQYEFIQIYMSNSPYTEIARDTGNGAIINLATDTTVNVLIAISVGTAVNNSVYKPMLRIATDTDSTYAPYAMPNIELTEKVKKENVTGVTWTATATTKGFNIARQGSVVCIRGYINPTEAVAAWGEVVTGLPKPMIGAYMSDTKTDGAFSIEATGNVGHMIAATALNVGTQYTFAFTYLAAD